MAGWSTSMKGSATRLGVGSRLAANTGAAFPAVKYVDVFTNPDILITTNADSKFVTTVAAAAGITALTIVAAEEAKLRSVGARSLAICSDGAQTEKITVTGTDQFGTAQTEDITFNGAAVVKGTKVWGSVSSISQAARSGAANISVGWGDIFGTSRRIIGLAVDGCVFTTSSGVATAVQETTRPLKSTTASVHGVIFSTAIAATKTYVVRYISDEVR